MSAERDLHSDCYAKTAIVPAVRVGNTAVVSSIIDTQDFYALEFLTAIGVISDAGATFTVTMDEGDDSALSDATAVDSDFLVGTLAGAGFTGDDDNEVRRIGYVGKKRYVRYTITPAGNTVGAAFSVIALNAYPRSAATAENT